MENNLLLVEVRRIVESAKDAANRKQLHAAIEWALVNGCRHIIFYAFCRESRNLTDNERKKITRSDRLVLHYARDRKVYWKGTPNSDFFMRDIQAATAKQYIRNLSTRVNDALKSKAEAGWFPYRWTPLGF